MQEYRRSRTSEENRLLDALYGERIASGDIEELNQALRYAMLKVGLRNIPNEIEFAALQSHVIENYGEHTPGEIKLAFDMAISGRFDVDPVCYEVFSCLYISNILNAYRPWKSRTVEQIIRETKPETKALPPAEVNWGGEVEYYFQKLKAGVFISYMTYPLQLYRQMVKDGFLQHNPLYTDEQKKKAVFDQFEKDKERRERYYEYVNS